ncbi:MAG: TetR/AcrR family transcriptional regulator [Allomuricauda sp.]
MDSKEDLLAFAISNFTKFGSKRFSMDELAQSIGISKKTIYKYFDSKEELVTESLQYLLKNVRNAIENYVRENPNEEEPLQTIVFIYKLALTNLQAINPSFFYGLNKYYPKASKAYADFRADIIWNVVFPLLEKAQKMGQIRPNVNVELTCKVFLSRMEDTVYAKTNLFEEYSVQELLDHIVVNNLLGILTLEYLQDCKLDK